TSSYGDWSSDVCSSDLGAVVRGAVGRDAKPRPGAARRDDPGDAADGGFRTADVERFLVPGPRSHAPRGNALLGRSASRPRSAGRRLQPWVGSSAATPSVTNSAFPGGTWERGHW